MNMIETLSEDPRVTVRKGGPPDGEGACVVYWMQRAQRAVDNPAIGVAVEVGNALGKPVVVLFAPSVSGPLASLRHFRFLADGIPDLAQGLARRQIGFVLRKDSSRAPLRFCEEVRAAILIGDEDPLRQPEKLRCSVARQIRIPYWTVDADVIVPSKLLGKEHFAARTIRPKIHVLLPEFLVPLRNPAARVPWSPPSGLVSIDWTQEFSQHWKLDRSVQPVSSWRGGSKQAQRTLLEFIKTKLRNYPEERNHPELEGTSRLSPYLRFGHIGPHTVALAVKNAEAPEEAKQAFLEQLIVRRELATNFVRFNSLYDSMECLEPWASRSLAEHASDSRPMTYSDRQLADADTHDQLWNAAQKQMVVTGWMHNFLRMYWAKKILEWSPSIAAAYNRAVWLNDRHELDGSDPNSYEGVAWSIVGKHDRAWSDRPIFGKIRYMSQASTARKFDSKRYIEQIAAL